MQFAMEPEERGVQWLPVFFSSNQTAQRQAETNRDGQFRDGPNPWPFLPTVRAQGMNYPLDMYGTTDIQFDTQLQYPPMQMGKSFDQLQPLVFPDKYLHQILDLR